MRLLSCLLILVVPLTGCFRHPVHASPDMYVPSVLITPFEGVSSHVNTKKEIQGYMVDTIKLCNSRARYLKKYQDKFNSLTASK